MTPRDAYERLEQRFDRRARIRESASLLGWDRATMMPARGVRARKGQLAALDRHARELLRDPEVEEWLERAESDTGDLDEWERANLREMRRIWRLRTAPPPDLASEWVEARTECRAVWREARPDDDFARLRPHLERVLDLACRVADAVGEAMDLSRYDAMLERFSPGMRRRRVDRLFAEAEDYMPSIRASAFEHRATRERPDAPSGEISPEAQTRAARRLMKAVGFDFDAGRLDTSPHGFCVGNRHDVRITTRWDPSDIREGIYCVLHETGHAMYTRGRPAAWFRQPVGEARGMTIHESQSLLLERMACRTLAFCEFAGPIFEELFGHSEVFEPDNLHRLVTRVEPGFIRVEADEVTYPLHVLLRYDLETRLVEGELAVEELPAAWRRAMEERLGIVPEDDRDGCLQDIHWMDGMFGYFPTYLLGAMAAAQFYEAACEQLDGLAGDLRRGNFGPLVQWLREEVHGLGASVSFDEILESATGEGLESGALRRHLEARYGA